MDEAFEHLLTPRLVLRRFVPADAPAMAAYRSDPDVARYQSWTAPYPVDRAEVFIDSLASGHPDEPGGWYQIAIAERTHPDRILGDCAFHPRPDEPRVTDIGFTLAREGQGRGYATEAVGELVRYLFEERGKHKVAADCDTRNAASWRLLERLGFTREGWLRESFEDEDGWADEYLYGLLHEEWLARGARSRLARADE
jgi:RimJ/RimL family protein N-acetyltransferase